jgi:nucleoside-diphosphate-sugar epimerase
MSQSERAKERNQNHCDGDCEECGLRSYEFCDKCGKCNECHCKCNSVKQIDNKILVLGGTGMVGKNLQKAFSENNLQGTFIGRGINQEFDLRDWQKTDNLFNQFDTKTVILLSATVGGIKFNIDNPARLIKDNLLIGLNVLDACVKYNVDNLYITSTCCSYPKYCPIPFKETDLWQGEEEYSNSFYGVAKKAIIKASQAYRKQYGLKTTCFILANLYGAFDHFETLENSHVIPALIRKFEEAREQNLPEVKCWGTGEISRDFLFAEDVSNVLVKAIKSQFDYDEPINLGTGVEIFIKDLAEQIKELTVYQGTINFTGEISNGQPKRCLDTSRAKSLMNWQYKTNLREGLIKTIDWYRKNLEEEL